MHKDAHTKLEASGLVKASKKNILYSTQVILRGKKKSILNRYFDVLTNCMKKQDENKSTSTVVNLEKKEDQEETKPFPLFHS